MPEEQIEAARAAFNQQRSVRLEQLIADGTRIKQEVDEKQAEIAKLKENRQTPLSAEAATLEARIEKGHSMVEPFNFRRHCAAPSSISLREEP